MSQSLAQFLKKDRELHPAPVLHSTHAVCTVVAGSVTATRYDNQIVIHSNGKQVSSLDLPTVASAKRAVENGKAGWRQQYAS
jgi:hypothetical protein